MPRIDPFTLPRPSSVTEQRTFTDAHQSGVEIALRFVACPDYGEKLKIQTLSDQFSKQFIGEDVMPIVVGGGEVRIDGSMCVVIATLQTLHKPEDPGDWYTFESWAALSVVMPTAFYEIVKWADDLIGMAAKADTGDDEMPKVPNGSAEDLVSV